MATKGTITRYFYGMPSGTGYETLQDRTVIVTFDWELVSQSIPKLTSTINWKVTFTCNKPSNVSSQTSYFNFCNAYLNGTFVKGGSYTVAAPGTRTISGSATFNHVFETGRTTFNFRFEMQCREMVSVIDGETHRNQWGGSPLTGVFEADISYLLENYSPDLVKATITSAPDFTDEDNPTIYFTVPTTATSVQAGISFTGAEMNIPYKTISASDTSYSFNFSDKEYSDLVSYLRSSGVATEDGLVAPVRFYLLTDGNKTDYVTRTATLIDYKPFLEPKVYDTNQTAVNLTGGTDENPRLIKYISKAAYEVNALGRKGATITSVSAKNGENTLTTATGTFENPADGNFYFDAIDNYGYRSGRLIEVHFVDYVKLTCSASVGKMTGDGDVSVTIKGKYFNGSFGKERNALSLSYTTKEKQSGVSKTVDWHEVTPTVSGNDYTYTFTIPESDLEYTKVYDISIDVKDKAMPTISHTEAILAADPIFDWGRHDFNFNVPISFNGVQMMDFICEQGVSGNWTYRKWNSGLMECWGFIKGTVDVMTQWGGVYRSNANIQDYFPVSFVNYPIVQATPSYDNYGNYWLATFSTQSGMNRTPSYQICLGENAVNVNYKISFYAIGK